MYEYFYISIAILIILLCSIFFSMKFQKDFYYLNRSPNFFAIYGAIIITMIGSFFILILSDIMKLNRIKNERKSENTPIHSGENNYTIKTENHPLLYISIINIFFYVLVPFVFFYFIEEKNCHEEETSETPNTMDHNENENLLQSDGDRSNINPSFSQLDNSPWNISLAKNYLYYLIAYCCLNIAYLIAFKINNLDSAKNLIRYSIMPEEMRKFSSFNSEFEIIVYANFGLLITLGKFLLLIYLPYGMGNILANTIDKLKKKKDAKNEYNRLDNNFTKNYETIKAITSKKLMTGRPLTKKEKKTLKSCKETEAVLQHKQEVLEEKFSTFQNFVYYLMLPLRYFFIIVFSAITVGYLISKGWIVYNELFNSICGSECGFIPNTNRARFTFQEILFYVTSYDRLSNGHVLFKTLIVALFVLLFVYFISGILASLYRLGIFNFIFISKSYSHAETSSQSHLKLIIYSIFSILSFTVLIEIFKLVPDFSFFYDNYEKCDIFNIGSSQCSISVYGLISMKLYINFVIFKYVDLLLSVLLIFLITILVIYIPIKSNLEYFSEDDEEKGLLNNKN